MKKNKDTQLIWENYGNVKEPVSDDMHQEELDLGSESGDYINFLKQMAQQSQPGSDGDAMENVLSHPFEETYGEYLRSKNATTVYTAAKAHMKLAEQMGVYHEVDIQDLNNWKYS